MSLVQLRTIDAVARPASMTGAAGRLYVTRPAVTSHVKGRIGVGDGAQSAQDADALAKGTEGYQSIFAPRNLDWQVGVGDGESDRKNE